MKDIMTRVKKHVRRVLHNNRGFTLIELLIVLAIIAILAGIAIPRYTASLTKAKESACAANVAILESAVMRYWADNDFEYPTGLTVQDLVDGGFIREEPVCPVKSSASYTLDSTDDYSVVHNHN
jgi:prepilin-type N-terminal cleavage/methylation domain-containing protein